MLQLFIISLSKLKLFFLKTFLTFWFMNRNCLKKKE